MPFLIKPWSLPRSVPVFRVEPDPPPFIERARREPYPLCYPWDNDVEVPADAFPTSAREVNAFRVLPDFLSLKYWPAVSAEFRAFAANETSPVTQWLRALAKLAHRECGGAGVGAIGMCFTGNFALTMMLEPAMLAPVLSQPSLPLREPAGLEIAPEELAAVRARLDREDLTVLAYRFKGDKICRAERFSAYAAALGDRFIGRELPDEAANNDVSPFFARHVPFPHSVVTQHLIDQAGQPTSAARDEIITFFRTRLAPAAVA